MKKYLVSYVDEHGVTFESVEVFAADENKADWAAIEDTDIRHLLERDYYKTIITEI